jgi:hypothetical protein
LASLHDYDARATKYRRAQHVARSARAELSSRIADQLHDRDRCVPGDPDTSQMVVMTLGVVGSPFGLRDAGLGDGAVALEY